MTNSSSDRPGEFALIAELFAPLATTPGAFGLTDDAAIVAAPAEHDLLVTTDALIEGVHFFANAPPHLIAKKALRVNLSDLAAKGCEPLGYLLALSIPKATQMDWLRGFAEGLRQDQSEFGISLLGGNTTSTPGPLSITVTAFGHLPAGTMIRRSGAQPGDIVFVSGTIGDAGGGLACLKGEGAELTPPDREFLVGRYCTPEPRLDLGRAMRAIVSASIDVSDGLLADLGHVADASGVRILVESGLVPFSRALRTLRDADHAVFAATAGEDYEIAFTALADRRGEILALAEQWGAQISEVGRVESGSGVALLDNQGEEIPLISKGFTHF